MTTEGALKSALQELLSTLRMVACLNPIRDDRPVYNEVMRVIELAESSPTAPYTMWACNKCYNTFPDPVNMIDHLRCPLCDSVSLFAYHETGCEYVEESGEEDEIDEDGPDCQPDHDLPPFYTDHDGVGHRRNTGR